MDYFNNCSFSKHEQCAPWLWCDCTETCRSCFNVNFKIVFKTIHLCISWWKKKLCFQISTIFILFPLYKGPCFTPIKNKRQNYCFVLSTKKDLSSSALKKINWNLCLHDWTRLHKCALGCRAANNPSIINDRTYLR
jgi:hypothetical protein